MLTYESQGDWFVAIVASNDSDSTGSNHTFVTTMFCAHGDDVKPIRNPRHQHSFNPDITGQTPLFDRLRSWLER
jgi:hypothetical protein